MPPLLHLIFPKHVAPDKRAEGYCVTNSSKHLQTSVSRDVLRPLASHARRSRNSGDLLCGCGGGERMCTLSTLTDAWRFRVFANPKSYSQSFYTLVLPSFSIQKPPNVLTHTNYQLRPPTPRRFLSPVTTLGFHFGKRHNHKTIYFFKVIFKISIYMEGRYSICRIVSS